MQQIFCQHFTRYPLMKPQDAVKLAYQGAFGGGHLISDPPAAKIRLKEEFLSAPKQDIAFLEKIGGGRSRLHLNASACSADQLDSICFLFVEGTQIPRQNPPVFHELLSSLREMTGKGEAPFSPSELNTYLTDYLAAGCPMVSHTETYRAAYRPAYRVMEDQMLRLLPLFSAIDRRLAAGDTLTVAIDGMAAAGKSTLGALLQKRYGCDLIHMDDFFLPPELRTPERFATPGGNVHYERFREQVLAGLASGQTVSYDVFSCHEMACTHSVTVTPKQLTVIEGSYALHPALRDAYDLKVFYPIDPQEQLERIRLRNGEEEMLRFRDRWIPLENQYIAACHVPTCADFIL